MKANANFFSTIFLGLAILSLYGIPPLSHYFYPDQYKFFGFALFFFSALLLSVITLSPSKKFHFSLKKSIFFAFFFYQSFLLWIQFSEEGLFQFSLFFLFALYALLLAKTPFLRQNVWNLLPWIGTFLALYGLLQKCGIDFWDSPSIPIATLGNTNFLSTCLAPIMLYCLFRWKEQAQKKYLYFALCMGSTLFLTFGRAGWLGFIVGLLSGLWTLQEKKKVILILSILCLSTPFFFRNYDRIRQSIYIQTTQCLQDHFWLGVGWGQYENAFRPYRDVEEYYRSREGSICSESDWLQWFAEWGVLGGIFWTGILFSTLYHLRSTPAYFSAGVALLVGGLFNFPMHLPHGLLFLFTLIGTAFAQENEEKLPLPILFLVPFLGYPLFATTFHTLFYQQHLFTPERSISLLEKAISWFPHATTYEQLGKIYRQKNQIKEAQYCYQKALELESNRYTTWFEKGMLETDPLQKFSFFDRALHINPGYHLARYQKARYSWNTQKKSTAIEEYQQLLEAIQTQENLAPLPEKTYRLKVQTLYEMACIQLQRQQWNEASLSLKKLFELEPEHPEGLLEQGILYCAQNKRIEGKHCLEKAFRFLPQHPRLRFNLGQIYYLEKNWVKAYELFLPLETSPDLDPTQIKTFLRAIRSQLDTK